MILGEGDEAAGVVDSLSFSPNRDIVPGLQQSLSTSCSGKRRVEAEQGPVESDHFVFQAAHCFFSPEEGIDMGIEPMRGLGLDMENPRLF